MKQMDCHFHLRGHCARENQCLFKHDNNKKGSNKDAGKGGGKGKTQRSTAAGAVEEVIPVRNAAQSAITEEEVPPFVFLRPTSCSDINNQQRRVHPNDPIYIYIYIYYYIIYNFDAFKHKLPVVAPPEQDYCHSSILLLKNVPDVQVRVVWDGGAEGTSMSDRCMSRVLRAQQKAGLSDQECPMNGMARMEPAQRFFGFSEGHASTSGQVVDILGELSLCTVDGHDFPSLKVRMVPNQVDDVLLSATDLDRLGYDSKSDPDFFLFHGCGLSVPRETPVPNHIRGSFIRVAHIDEPPPAYHKNESDEIPSDAFIYVRGVTILRPHEVKNICVPCSTNQPLDASWLEGVETDTYTVASGPIDFDDSQRRSTSSSK